jgi:hypothetical protein
MRASRANQIINNNLNGGFMTRMIAEKGWTKLQARSYLVEWLIACPMSETRFALISIFFPSHCLAVCSASLIPNISTFSPSTYQPNQSYHHY